MKASQEAFAFPILGFVRDPKLGLLTWRFVNWDSLSICTAHQWRTRRPASLELIDVRGSRWKVTSARNVGRPGRLVPWLFASLLTWHSYRLEYEIEPLPSATLAEVKDLVCE